MYLVRNLVILKLYFKKYEAITIFYIIPAYTLKFCGLDANQLLFIILLLTIIQKHEIFVLLSSLKVYAIYFWNLLGNSENWKKMRTSNSKQLKKM